MSRIRFTIIPSIPKLWYAVALLVASTVGIGFFGIPQTFAEAGTGVGVLFLLFLTGFVLIINLMYGEIILRTHTRHQLVGYVRRYLGPWAQRVNTINFWIAVYGSYIALLIINGQFLADILGYWGIVIAPVWLSLVYLGILAVFVIRGLRSVSHLDFFIMLAVFVFVVGIVYLGAPVLKREYFEFFTYKAWFLPFGVLLFSLNGIQGIPLVRESLVGHEHRYRKAIIAGTLIPAFLYLVFAVVVVGVSGPDTSPHAISGLAIRLGGTVTLLGSMIGFFTSSTIFVSIASAFRNSLREDFHLRRPYHFFLLLIPPVVLFILGVRDFIGIIGLVGGVAVSIDMILLLLVYARASVQGDRVPEYSLHVPHSILYAMIAIFCAGALYTLFV